VAAAWRCPPQRAMHAVPTDTVQAEAQWVPALSLLMGAPGPQA